MPRESSSVHGKIFHPPGIETDVAQKLLDLPAKRIIAEGRRGRLEQIEADGIPYARKVYKVTKKSLHGTAVRFLPAFMRWGRVRRSWKAMLRGEEFDLPLPRAIARRENRQLAQLVCTWIPGEPLHHWHARQLIKDPEPSWQFRFADWIGVQLHQLLNRGFTTRDLSPNNVLIEGDRHGPWQFHVVDLDEARILRRSDGERYIDQVIHSLSQIGHLPPTIPPRLKLRALDSFLAAGGKRWAIDQGEFSAKSSSFVDEKRAQKKFIRQVIDGVLRFDRRKEEHLKRESLSRRFAGWGLDEDGVPVPFDGARVLDQED
ncbi:MAG: hypothetical protein CBC13_02635 [Planctomycetia bacterium TMED53]|nr:MAG: hypothetical protein CBC13_02635 [Planctomycetia bacterium TMED53]